MWPQHGGEDVEDICWTYIHKNVLDGIVFAATDVVGGNECMWKGNQCLFPQICFEMGYNFLGGLVM